MVWDYTAPIQLSPSNEINVQDTISIFAFGEAFGGVQAASTLLQTEATSAIHKQKEGVYKFQPPKVPLHDAVRVLFDVCTPYNSLFEPILKSLE